MKSNILLTTLLALFCLPVFAQQTLKHSTGHRQRETRKHEYREKKHEAAYGEFDVDEDQNDKPDEAILFEAQKTKDPATGRVPRERLWPAIEAANNSKLRRQQNSMTATAAASLLPGLSWSERGPNNVGGRTRALIFDLNDSINYLKVWAGGVNGGLWYTNDISAASPTWNKVDDRFNNLSVSCLAQSKSTKNVMYFGTGEGWYNVDAVAGAGIWKSTNGGSTWTQLSSTNNSTFSYVQKNSD